MPILSLSFIRNGQFSLRKLNAVFQKMFVLGNGFRQFLQENGRSVGGGGGETRVVIFGFRVGIGPVFAGYVSNRAAVRGCRNGDKVLQNKIGNLALFFRRQRSNFVQNGPGFCAHDLNYITSA